MLIVVSGFTFQCGCVHRLFHDTAPNEARMDNVAVVRAAPATRIPDLLIATTVEAGCRPIRPCLCGFPSAAFGLSCSVLCSLDILHFTLPHPPRFRNAFQLLANRHGMTKVMLTVFKENKQAMSFYTNK